MRRKWRVNRKHCFKGKQSIWVLHAVEKTEINLKSASPLRWISTNAGWLHRSLSGMDWMGGKESETMVQANHCLVSLFNSLTSSLRRCGWLRVACNIKLHFLSSLWTCGPHDHFIWSSWTNPTLFLPLHLCLQGPFHQEFPVASLCANSCTEQPPGRPDLFILWIFIAPSVCHRVVAFIRYQVYSCIFLWLILLKGRDSNGHCTWHFPNTRSYTYQYTVLIVWSVVTFSIHLFLILESMSGKTDLPLLLPRCHSRGKNAGKVTRAWPLVF